VPASSKNRDNTSNLRPTNPKPPHGKNRAREDSPSPEPPKRNLLASHRPPVQRSLPRTAPVGPNARSTTGEARQAGPSQLEPAFEHRPAQRSRSKHTQAVNPQQSTSVSPLRLPANLPPWEPPSPSAVSSPDFPNASPPVPPEDIDLEDPYDERPGPSNISLTQPPRSRSPSNQRSRSNSSSHSRSAPHSLSPSRSHPHSQSHSRSPSHSRPRSGFRSRSRSHLPSQSRSHLPSQSRSRPNSSQSSNLHQFHNEPPAISASPPQVQNTSTTIQSSAPSRMAPGAQSAPRKESDLRGASSSKHKSSRPTLTKPYPGRCKS
jgi:hypothetical protein